MKKYADIDLVNEKLMRLRDKCGNEEMAFALNWALQLMRDIKTVDAVEVVRCRFCKHHHYDKDDIPYCDRIDYGYGWKDDDFCSKGNENE